jgi:beta-lactam-binding protein with PASTA domain/predicted Ser/Thr protein kinase
MSEQGPTVFKDRYEVHRKLARGGMSDVYLARDRVLDRPVALKVLFPEYAKDATFVARFRREAQAAARLNHPNIVGVYDWGEETGTYFIAMEYIEGRTLSEIVRAEGPMHPRRAAEIAADTAAALGFAHRNGVIHRDVKPGNVMVETSGLVKVADFGIAQAVGGPEQTQLTRVGSVMGTATYFSPEQAQGRQVDPRSDIYSLGCVMFEILTGQPPFAGETPVAIAYKHVQEAPPHPSELVQVPPGLDAIVMKCLAKSPDGRYSTSEELRTDLRRFLEGHPVAAMAGAGAATGSSTAATAAFAGAGAMAGAAAGYDATSALPATGGYPPATGMTGTVPPAYGEPGDEKKKQNPWLIAALVVFLVLVAGGLLYLATTLSGEKKATVTVPNVVGQPYEAAEPALSSKFKVKREDKANTQYKAGIIFDTDPPVGQSVEEGSALTVFVSSGTGEVAVADVRGQAAADAKRTLTEQGFVIGPDQLVGDDSIEAGKVVRTDPPAGSMKPKGTSVIVVVSAGKSTVPVPDVRGLQQSTALANLTTAGFTKTSIERVQDATIPSGSVVGTNPPIGTPTDKNALITVYVSTGPPPTTTQATTTTTRPSSTTTSTETTDTTDPPRTTRTRG